MPRSILSHKWKYLLLSSNFGIPEASMKARQNQLLGDGYNPKHIPVESWVSLKISPVYGYVLAGAVICQDVSLLCVSFLNSEKVSSYSNILGKLT